jgi:hypothetical protein
MFSFLCYVVTSNNITQENFNILVVTAYKTGLPLILYITTDM